MTKPKKVCALEGCDKEFVPYRSTSKFCSRAHAVAHGNSKLNPTFPDRPCEFCGKVFTPKRGNQIYCSRAHSRQADNLEGRLEPRETSDVEELLRQENAELRAKLKQTKVANAFEERLLERVSEVVPTLPVVPAPRPHRTAKRTVHEDAVLMLSDLHAGEYVSAIETGGLGGYDFDTFTARMEHLSQTVRTFLLDTMQGYSFDTLHINGLGDYVSGIIHDEFIETNELHIIDQMLYTELVLVQFLRELCLEFPKVEVSSVVGNHGRTQQQKKSKLRATCNFDYAIMSHVASQMKDQPNIEFHLPRSFWTTREIRGWQFLNMHGDNVRSWNGIPWYGINRAVARFTELLASRRQFFDYVCLAHFHQAATLQGVRGERLINGSLIGPSEYGMDMVLASEPLQYLFGVHAEHGLTWKLGCTFRGVSDAPTRYAADLSLAPHEQAV